MEKKNKDDDDDKEDSKRHPDVKPDGTIKLGTLMSASIKEDD